MPRNPGQNSSSPRGEQWHAPPPTCPAATREVRGQGLPRWAPHGFCSMSAARQSPISRNFLELPISVARAQGPAVPRPAGGDAAVVQTRVCRAALTRRALAGSPEGLNTHVKDFAADSLGCRNSLTISMGKAVNNL